MLTIVHIFVTTTTTTTTVSNICRLYCFWCTLYNSVLGIVESVFYLPKPIHLVDGWHSFQLNIAVNTVIKNSFIFVFWFWVSVIF